MPIFPVDGGLPLATRAMRPADTTYGASVVDEHLGALLGEHLLPVRSRRAGDDEPYLLAVDAHGRPVVVEVVGLLDGATLLRALVYLGRAARLSLRDLAGLYRGGANRFNTDLATFRESVPVVRLGAGGGGARLLLVCAQVADGMGDVVAGLADRGIEVLKVGLVDGPGGHLIDVSPVHLAAPDGSWSVSNGVASLTAGGPTPETRPEPGIGEPPDEDTLSELPPRPPGTVVRVPTGVRPLSGVPAQSAQATPSGGLPAASWSVVPDEPPTPVPVGADDREHAEHEPAPAASGHAAGSHRLDDHAPNHHSPDRHELDSRAPDHSALDDRALDHSAPDHRALDHGALDDRALDDHADRSHNGVSRSTGGPLPVRPASVTVQAPRTATADVPVVAGDGRLSRLAQSGPVALVWHRRRRGEYLEALVHTDGLIELEDGTRLIDPSAAAEIASGSQVPVDGWRVWRVGHAEGPTLAEACES
ncbi:hypothetical protein OEB99_11715 [Actinotalea sp. M2MS4P-6]|uniref:hypothetical protein n=1 Tax=Actinotalea sp. M2MS4P-6 TaxID=2983762 RepID=UPI0021E493FA|nr:hypothetical protein [Actinotalea sp. M2MS4P-6]MCV2394975.1 hypothetical protein [Actinotalea sp. M2MS4P-6]